MKLHWSPRSPFVRKVMVVVHELGLADRIACVRAVAATTKPHAELMQDNPLSKIPTLVLDDGTVIYDSPVICEYLDGLDGGPKLHPAEPQARLVALRRQALGDGFLDMLVLLRDERMRAHPSDCTKRAPPCARRRCSIAWTKRRRRSPPRRSASAISRSAARSAISISATPTRIGGKVILASRAGTLHSRRGHRCAPPNRSTTLRIKIDPSPERRIEHDLALAFMRFDHAVRVGSARQR
jgi:glutathione S-transferase